VSEWFLVMVARVFAVEKDSLSCLSSTEISRVCGNMVYLVLGETIMGSLESTIAGILGLLISGVAFWAALRLLRMRPILDRWATVNGTVTERGTFVPTEPDLTVPGFRHSPLVRYEYQVGGQTFVSDRIHPKRLVAPARNHLKWAEKRAASFPNEVLVHYNPENPSESFLERMPSSTAYLFFLGGLLALMYAVVILVTR
jgi:hypothetical protein